MPVTIPTYTTAMILISHISINFLSNTGDRAHLSVYTADYCDWRDQEYAELLSPKPFLRELRSIQKRMRINDK